MKRAFSLSLFLGLLAGCLNHQPEQAQLISNEMQASTPSESNKTAIHVVYFKNEELYNYKKNGELIHDILNTHPGEFIKYTISESNPLNLELINAMNSYNKANARAHHLWNTMVEQETEFYRKQHDALLNDLEHANSLYDAHMTYTFDARERHSQIYTGLDKLRHQQENIVADVLHQVNDFIEKEGIALPEVTRMATIAEFHHPTPECIHEMTDEPFIAPECMTFKIVAPELSTHPKIHQLSTNINAAVLNYWLFQETIEATRYRASYAMDALKQATQEADAKFNTLYETQIMRKELRVSLDTAKTHYNELTNEQKKRNFFIEQTRYEFIQAADAAKEQLADNVIALLSNDKINRSVNLNSPYKPFTLEAKEYDVAFVEAIFKDTLTEQKHTFIVNLNQLVKTVMLNIDDETQGAQKDLTNTLIDFALSTTSDEL
ncbi:hypothetical protein F7U66_01410 [Vibrio parahaemolyticus]|nr:hypothetical protein [Vibrio parahaemolyticus]